MKFLDAMRQLWRRVTPRSHRDVEEEFQSSLDAYQEDLMRQAIDAVEERRQRLTRTGRRADQDMLARGDGRPRLFLRRGGLGERPGKPFLEWNTRIVGCREASVKKESSAVS